MKKTVAVLSFVLALCVSTSLLLAQGQSDAHRRIVVPDSSVEHPGKAHTNHLILLSEDPADRAATQPSHETPGSLACVYKLVPTLVPGCPIATSTTVPSGGSGIIAIVDAFDYPTAYKDLSSFSRQFGLPVLPQCSKNKPNMCFQKVYATGAKPPVDCGWAQESALDIEWAHAMAPNASIYLVEAGASDPDHMMAAVEVANALINPIGAGAGTGLGQVSMSWGSPETGVEVAYNGHFATPGVVYFAASGDRDPVNNKNMIYPGTSPFVVSAGGTSLIRDAAGSFTGESAWAGSGGGISLFEPHPGYQDVLGQGNRAVPDISFDADPSSGVAVFDSTPCSVNGVTTSGWQVFGGTSVAAPSLAGIANLAGSKYHSTDTELGTIYACYATGFGCYDVSFRDITTGSTSPTTPAGVGWDFTTGVGGPIGLNNK